MGLLRQEDGQDVEGFTIEGRNAVIEAFRAGRTIDKLYLLEDCQDGPIMTIRREAGKQDTLIKYVSRERLDQISGHGKHQGVIAVAAAYAYAEVEDMLKAAKEKGEPPFLILLDNIEDPHNLGAIIRTANLAGAHGVIIPRNRAMKIPVPFRVTVEDWLTCSAMGGEQQAEQPQQGQAGPSYGAEEHSRPAPGF